MDNYHHFPNTPSFGIQVFRHRGISIIVLVIYEMKVKFSIYLTTKYIMKACRGVDL
jgi:hypothetical protein